MGDIFDEFEKGRARRDIFDEFSDSGGSAAMGNTVLKRDIFDEFADSQPTQTPGQNPPIAPLAGNLQGGLTSYRNLSAPGQLEPPSPLEVLDQQAAQKSLESVQPAALAGSAAAAVEAAMPTWDQRRSMGSWAYPTIQGKVQQAVIGAASPFTEPFQKLQKIDALDEALYKTYGPPGRKFISDFLSKKRGPYTYSGTESEVMAEAAKTGEVNYGAIANLTISQMIAEALVQKPSGYAMQLAAPKAIDFAVSTLSDVLPVVGKEFSVWDLLKKTETVPLKDLENVRKTAIDAAVDAYARGASQAEAQELGYRAFEESAKTAREAAEKLARETGVRTENAPGIVPRETNAPGIAADQFRIPRRPVRAVDRFLKDLEESVFKKSVGPSAPAPEAPGDIFDVVAAEQTPTKSVPGTAEGPGLPAIYRSVPEAPQVLNSKGQAPQSPQGKPPAPPESENRVFPAPLGPFVNSIAQHPDYVKLTNDAKSVVQKYAKAEGVAPTPEYAEALFFRLHKEVGRVGFAAPADQPAVKAEIKRKYPDLQSEFMALSMKRNVDVTPTFFQRVIAGNYPDNRRPLAARAGAPAAPAAASGPGQLPLGAGPSRPVALEGNSPIPESEIRQRMDDLYQQAAEERGQKFTELERFIIDQGGIKTNYDTKGEYAMVPVRLRGTMPADTLAQNARDAGVLGSDKDFFKAVSEIPKRGRLPKIGQFRDQAIRELEQEYQEMGPPYARPQFAASEADMEPAPFEKGPGYGITESKPSAEFIGYNPPFADIPPTALYNIQGPHPQTGSTVSARTLQNQGIRVPETPPYETWKTGASNAGGDIREQGPKYNPDGPIFYSQLQKTIQEKLPNRASAEQVRGVIRDVKREEKDWSGIEEFLQGKPSVTKQEVMDFLKSNEVQVRVVVKSGSEFKNLKQALSEKLKSIDDLGFDSTEEALRAIREYEDFSTRWDLENRPDIVELGKQYREASVRKLGDTRFSSRQLPGGENYRELLLTFSKPVTFNVYDTSGRILGEFKTLKEAQAADFKNKAFVSESNDPLRKNSDFKSGHFDEPNILAHVRFNDRTGPNGEKILFIEEVQSDWHQQGRREGYDLGQFKEFEDFIKSKGVRSDISYSLLEENGASKEMLRRFEDAMKEIKGSLVPNAPFKKTWPELAMKRMLRWAVDNGYDKIAWTTGEQQADRYDLSHQVKEVRVFHRNDGTFDISTTAAQGGDHDIGTRIPSEKLGDYLGKDLADKIRSDAGSRMPQPHGAEGVWRKYQGVDLKVGGEGMKGFYDQILPSFLNKYTKKWGGRVGTTQINTSGKTLYPSNIHTLEGRRMVAKRGEGFQSVHSFDITPSMRESVAQGQSLFEKQPGLFGGAEPVTTKPVKPGAPGQMSLFGQKANPKFNIPGTAFQKIPELTGPQEKQLEMNDESHTVPQAEVPKALHESVIVEELADAGTLPVSKMKIESPADAAAIFQFLKDETVESFHVISLDANNNVLGAQMVSLGTLNSSLVHPRDAFKGAVLLKAEKVVFLHNHPSHDPTPSQEDLALTKRFAGSAKSAGIEVLYHVVINDKKFGLIGAEGDFQGLQSFRDPGQPFSNIRLVKTKQAWIAGDKLAITNHFQAAQFLRSLQKNPAGAVVLALNTRGEPTAVWHLGAKFPDSVESLVSVIGKISIRNNAASVILSSDAMPKDEYLYQVKSLLDKNWGVELLDATAFKSSFDAVQSARENGVLESGPEYGKPEPGDMGAKSRENRRRAIGEYRQLKNLKYIDNRPLKFEPFDLTTKGGITKTAADMRLEYTGALNAQKVKIEHLAQDIRRTIPNKIEREGLALYRDANQQGTLFSKTREEVLRAALESDNPGLVALRPAIRSALNPTPAMLRADALLSDYYAETGAVGKAHGFLSSLVDEERYINRIYKPEPPEVWAKTETMRPGLGKTTGHAKQRFYETILDAIEHGKRPATLDAAELVTIHGAEFARTLANNKIFEAMKKQGLGFKIKSGEKIPPGWTVFGQPKIAKFLTKDGEPAFVFWSFVIPEQLEAGLRTLTDPNYLNRLSGYKTIRAIQGLTKTVDLSLSFFHHFTLLEQLLYQNTYGFGIPSFVNFVRNADYRKLEIAFTRAGGLTSTVDANLEVMRQLSEGNDSLAKALRLPLMRQYMSLINKNNKFLFGRMQPYFKVMDWGKHFSAWEAKHPLATPAERIKAQRSYAKEINAAYGGLNWKALGITAMGLAIGRLLVLAPDWSYSNIQLLKMAAEGGPGGNLARAHFITALIGGLIMTESLNRLITGHGMMDNAEGHKFEVEVRPGVYVSFFRGAIGDAIKWGNMMAEHGGIIGTARMAQGKLAPFARTAIGIGVNTDYYGRPISKKNDSFLKKTWNGTKFIAQSAGPVPFGFSALAHGGSLDPISDILLLSGLARPGKPGIQKRGSSSLVIR